MDTKRNGWQLIFTIMTVDHICAYRYLESRTHSQFNNTHLPLHGHLRKLIRTLQYPQHFMILPPFTKCIINVLASSVHVILLFLLSLANFYTNLVPVTNVCRQPINYAIKSKTIRYVMTRFYFDFTYYFLRSWQTSSHDTIGGH